jgi:hypothetical protein
MKKTNILTLLSAVVIGSSFTIEKAMAADPTNLILNPGFESGLTSWKNNGSTYAVTKPASGFYSARSGTSQGGVSQSLKLTVGQTYTLKVTARLEALSVSALVSIRFKNAAGALLQENKMPILSTSFRTYSVTVKVPANAAVAEVYSLKESGALSYLYVDDFSLVDVSTTPKPTPVPAPTPIPVPIPTPTTGYAPIGIGGGGAMSGVSISPYSSLWFVGTDMGTLFRSTDLGASWVPVNQYQATFDSDLTRAVSVGFSSDGVTVFHASAGINPKRSSDAGINFATISMGLQLGEIIKYWTADSSNGNVIYAGTNKGMLKSANKGSSWTRVAGIAEESMGTFIDQNSATKRIYHATKSAIYYSDNNGATFSVYYTPIGLSVREFTGGSDSNGVTLAFGDNDGANACSWAYGYLNDWGQASIDANIAHCGYVWVSTGGQTFTKKTQAVGDHLKMAENDSSTIYTTGSTSWIRQYGTKVHVSHDKGASFALKLNQIDYDVIPYAPWSPSKLEYSAVALDIGWWDSGYESFTINARNSNMVAGSGYFFLHSSINGGNTWQAPFTKFNGTGTPTKGQTWKSRGLEVTSVYKMKFHPTNPSIMYAAMADIGGVASEDHGNSFRITKSQFNSIYDYAFNPNDDSVVFAAEGSLHDFPNEWHANSYTGNGGIYKSLDRGRTFQRLTPVDTNYNRQFLSVGYDALHNTIYGGTQEAGIARSGDGGVTWSYMNTGLPGGAKIIPQIEVDPNNGNVYALLTGDAPTYSNQASTGVYILDIVNGATSWKLLRGTVAPATGASASQVWFYPTAFAIDFNNPGTIYLTDYENHNNWLMTGVWKTTNGGANWNRIKQVTHPTDVKIDPKNASKLYVSAYYQLDGQWGDGGQLYTKDGGTTWFRNSTPGMQNNAKSVAVDPTDPTKIFYSYFGGGMLYGMNPNY